MNSFRLAKLQDFIIQHRALILLMFLTLIYMSATIASNSNGAGTNDAAFANGYGWLDSVIHGKLGVLLAAVAFIVGLVISISKQSPMFAVGGVIFALLIAFGPDMATGIVNSSLIVVI
ncbi:MAG TPA: hypothetical protein PLP75_01060 [Burkholderiales bacterium]|nr:hypothetical protein [Burkholderiales bacterium]